MKKKRISRSIKQKQEEIINKNIQLLFDEADKIYSYNPSLSDRYVKLARQIAMKFRYRIPKEYKRRFCRHCYAFFKPGVNCRVRLNHGKIIYYCLKCKKYTRIPLN